jgi:outer membrane protein assembly factor BamB/fibronectin type 3 domain-containing protein
MAQRLLAALCLLGVTSAGWSAPPEATAYQITVDHAGVTTSGGVLALQLQPLWTVNLSAAGAYPLIVGNVVYEVAGGLLYALDAQTGATVWGPTEVANAFAATADGGSIFVISSGGLMSSFDAATGTPGWSAQMPGQLEFTSPPTASNGIVYTGGAESGGTVYAVNETSGAVLWTAGVANGDNSSPAVGPNAVFVSYVCQNTYAFNLTTGTLIWHNPTSCEGGGGDTPVYANGQLYARDPTSSNEIFDASTGAILGSFASTTPPAVDATTAYYLSGGTLSAVDATTQVVRWTFAGDGGLTSAPLVVDQTVIIGSSSGLIYGLNEQSGQVTWQVNTGQAIPTGVEWFSTPNGFAIADGVLVVPAGSSLIAYSIFGPPAPTNVTAAAAAGAAQLSWTAAAGATSYNIYVATQAGAEPFTATVTGVAGTTALVPNLTPGTTYYFTVKALGPQGISAASNEASAVAVVPSPPTALVATPGVGLATLSWSASGNATSYNVYVGTSAGGESATPALTSVTALGATVPGLTPGVSYYFVVKGVANGAISAASNEATAIPTAAVPPTMLAGTAVSGGAFLYWTGATGASSYQVYVGNSAGGESATPAQSGIGTTSTTISPLTSGQPYYFVVRSVTYGVVSGPSNEVSVTPLTYPGPGNLVLTPAIDQITISWSASAAATAYSVFMGTAAGKEAVTPVQTVTGLQAVIGGLTAGTTYYFYVVAQTPSGPSAASVERSAVAGSPPGPTNLAATAGTDQVTLTWSASAGATSYNVYEGTTAGGEASAAVQTGITGLSTVVSGLTGGTEYFYEVRAETANGLSAASNEASATATGSSGGGGGSGSSNSGGGGGGALDVLGLLTLGLLTVVRLRHLIAGHLRGAARRLQRFVTPRGPPYQDADLR